MAYKHRQGLMPNLAIVPNDEAAAPAANVSAIGDPATSLRSHDPSSGRRIDTWPIARLRDHHQTADLFRDLAGAEFDDLVASLKREGLRVPIEVTPERVIIDGHQRVRAARELGWSEITVWVRDNLAGDQAAIDRAHIGANMNRRQLDPLDKVRLARRLAELELGRKPGQLQNDELKALCGCVAEQMRLSPRHAQRLINISTIPIQIQRAYSAGQLPLVDADRVSRLGPGTQGQIARSIEDGGNPARIVAPHLPEQARKVKPRDAYKQLIVDCHPAAEPTPRKGRTRPRRA
jgi:ParB/RepB/Spo0J family partition protein